MLVFSHMGSWATAATWHLAKQLGLLDRTSLHPPAAVVQEAYLAVPAEAARMEATANAASSGYGGLGATIGCSSAAGQHTQESANCFSQARAGANGKMGHGTGGQVSGSEEVSFGGQEGLVMVPCTLVLLCLGSHTLTAILDRRRLSPQNELDPSDPWMGTAAAVGGPAESRAEAAAATLPTFTATVPTPAEQQQLSSGIASVDPGSCESYSKTCSEVQQVYGMTLLEELLKVFAGLVLQHGQALEAAADESFWYSYAPVQEAQQQEYAEGLAAVRPDLAPIRVVQKSSRDGSIGDEGAASSSGTDSPEGGGRKSQGLWGRFMKRTGKPRKTGSFGQLSPPGGASPKLSALSRMGSALFAESAPGSFTAHQASAGGQQNDAVESRHESLQLGASGEAVLAAEAQTAAPAGSQPAANVAVAASNSTGGVERGRQSPGISAKSGDSRAAGGSPSAWGSKDSPWRGGSQPNSPLKAAAGLMKGPFRKWGKLSAGGKQEDKSHMLGGSSSRAVPADDQKLPEVAKGGVLCVLYGDAQQNSLAMSGEAAGVCTVQSIQMQDHVAKGTQAINTRILSASMDSSDEPQHKRLQRVGHSTG